MAKKTLPSTKPAAKKRAPRALDPVQFEAAAREPPAAERVKRPPLPRSEPIRSWSTLFGAPGDASAASAPPFGMPGMPNIPGIPGIPGMNGAAGMGPEAVRRGVEMGYRVVDEYLRQGASVANAFSNPSRPRGVSGATSGPGGAEPDLSKMTERMMQYASDFTSLWYDAMGMMMGTMSQQSRPDVSKRPNGAEAPSPDGSSALLGHSRIILDVRSTLAAEIIIALDEPAYSGALTVEELKPRTGKSSIAGARVEPASEAHGPLKVHVHVVSNVAPGRYTGAILDAVSGKPKGRLTVTLSK